MDAGDPSAIVCAVRREGRARSEAALSEAAARVAGRFAGALRERVALTRDRDLADTLASEVLPVAEALLDGLGAASRVDRDAPELREALALTSLLGRRAALLGVTPTGALAIVPALIAALSGETDRGAALSQALIEVCIEGYVAERDEQAAERAAARAAKAIPVVEVAPGCVVVIAAGLQDAGELERVIDDVGRVLLERGARACVMDAGALEAPDPERARYLFAIHATCMMLGVECVFSRVSDAWIAAGRDAGLRTEELRVEPQLTEALRIALAACDLELRRRAGLGDVLRRMVKRR